jgi:hypothetical protein
MDGGELTLSVPPTETVQVRAFPVFMEAAQSGDWFRGNHQLVASRELPVTLTTFQKKCPPLRDMILHPTRMLKQRPSPSVTGVLNRVEKDCSAKAVLSDLFHNFSNLCSMRLPWSLHQSPGDDLLQHLGAMLVHRFKLYHMLISFSVVRAMRCHHLRKWKAKGTASSSRLNSRIQGRPLLG